MLIFSFMLVPIYDVFCNITGLLSTSKSKYDPPCKSKPKLIFLLKKLILLKKLLEVKKIKNKVNKVIETILNLEKYNTESKILFFCFCITN